MADIFVLGKYYPVMQKCFEYVERYRVIAIKEK